MKDTKSFRPIPGLSREAEERQLAVILGIAQDNLERTEAYLGQLSEDLHELMETYGTKDKEALALFHNTQSQLREYQRDLVRCQKARKKPYFGRIDFQDSEIPWEESYYVGRVGISEHGKDPAVIDWRAPIASVYYENTMGRCSYTVEQEKTYEIDLKRKRTYEIEQDRLKDFFDSDVVANDDLLTKYLAKSKKAVLGEIIATIQKEQNAIIRTSPKTNLIVQGVAGSGKTTVAMHRISYILYNYEDDFRPEDFYIIGSNRILLNYITSVLPDLDVYGVSQMTMEQLFVRLLYEDWKEGEHRICRVRSKDEDDKRKGSYEWFMELEQFCKEYEKASIPKEEVRIEKSGVLLMDAAAIQAYLKDNPRLSMQSKILMLNEILLARLENELTGKYVSYTPEEKKELTRMCRRHFGGDIWKGSIFQVYREFLQSQLQKKRIQTLPEHVLENTFDVYDLAALAYIYKRIKEHDGIREASHVIIDEAQDFGMMAYGALSYCLRGCTYTIMGDVSQNISFGYGLNDWEQLKKLILTGDYDSFGLLKKSYRNTVEISDFATEILRHGNFSIYPAEPISRHGSEVRLIACDSENDMLQNTVTVINAWLKAGRETIAVICRDKAEASKISRWLDRKVPLVDSNLETTEFGSGVMVLPVEYTKGLEFDAVLLYNPSSGHYPAEDGYVKLLYVAATRALHELAVVHQDNLTDLIKKPVSQEKRMESLEQTRRSTDKQRKKAALPQTKPTSPKSRKPWSKDASKVKEPALMNTSHHRFGECPKNSLLHPKSHGIIDSSIGKLRKTKSHLDLIGPYGILRITPLEENLIRVQFQRGLEGRFSSGYWNYQPDTPVIWSAREGKSLAEVATKRLAVRIHKKTGALQFYDKEGKLLLAEQSGLPRQVEPEVEGRFQTWNYFDWPKSEKLSAKGILAQDLERMDRKARYISFGGQKLRMPLLVSNRGYGIGVACEHTVMCCNLSMYGPYLYTEGNRQIDYYFLYGETYENILSLYKKLECFGTVRD